MVLKEKDFIEVEFSARVKDGELFDTTNKKEAKILGIKEELVKPLILSIGQEMVIAGLDKDFLGKELDKEYTIEINPEEAFGKRDPLLIQMISLNNFKEQKVMPQRGMQFSLDGKIARVLSVSGGRVLLDFNHELAGKRIVYNYKILRKVEDKKEQIDSLQEFFIRKKFESNVDEKEIKIKVDKKFFPLLEMLKKRFEDILETKVSLEVINKEDKA